jgi:hypothetical protein
MDLMGTYSNSLEINFVGIFTKNGFHPIPSSISANSSEKNSTVFGNDSNRSVGGNEPVILAHQYPPSESDSESLLSVLLNEAQGIVRVFAPLSDLALVFSLPPFQSTGKKKLDAQQRFRLSVGLAKLGLFDLSLKHVWLLAATPWEAPLYKYPCLFFVSFLFYYIIFC